MKYIIILIALLLIGCGARKVNKSIEDIKIETKKDSTSTTNVFKKDTLVSVECLTTDEIEITPIDKNDTVTYIANGKTIKLKNAYLKLIKSNRIQSINTSKIIDSTASIEVKQDTKANIQSEEKSIDKESSFDWFNPLIIGIIIIIVTIIYLKNKSTS